MRKQSNERCRDKKKSKTGEKYKNWHLFFFSCSNHQRLTLELLVLKIIEKTAVLQSILQYHPIACDLISCSLFSFQSLYSRVPACQITTYYYVGFAYLMMKRYQVSMKKWKQTAYSYSGTFENELHLVGVYTCTTLLFPLHNFTLHFFLKVNKNSLI